MQVHIQLIVISAHLMVPSMPEHNNGVNSPTTNAKLKRYIYCQKIIHYIIIIIINLFSTPQSQMFVCQSVCWYLRIMPTSQISESYLSAIIHISHY